MNCPTNNHSWNKEMFRHYNRLDFIVNKHTREAKEKYSICKESNKFAKLPDLTPKEMDIKDYKRLKETNIEAKI